MAQQHVLLAGIIGLLASMLVGIGEGLLHYTPEGYVGSNPYDFMLPFSERRLAYGHFIAVLASPLYLIGYWHVYKMLTPKGGGLAAFITLAAGYGFVVGSVWIGSRAMIAGIVQFGAHANREGLTIVPLVAQYQFYMESLLQIIRVTTLIFSVGFVYLVWKGPTLYPTWMIFFNPCIILILIFLTYFFAPSVGKFIVPIAMNVANFLFFGASLIVAFSFSIRRKHR